MIVEVPDNPADPETAALNLIVELPTEFTPSNGAFREVLQDYCGLLQAEGAFADLTWPDAKQVAAAVSFDACTNDDAAGSLRGRAAAAQSGRDGMPWEDRDGVVRALNIAAEVLTW